MLLFRQGSCRKLCIHPACAAAPNRRSNLKEATQKKKSCAYGLNKSMLQLPMQNDQKAIPYQNRGNSSSSGTCRNSSSSSSSSITRRVCREIFWRAQQAAACVQLQLLLCSLSPFFTAASRWWRDLGGVAERVSLEQTEIMNEFGQERRIELQTKTLTLRNEKNKEKKR